MGECISNLINNARNLAQNDRIYRNLNSQVITVSAWLQGHAQYRGGTGSAPDDSK